ncbi:hypothetical protein Sjap_022983 [Stephania japonica]|uniref:Uncharacterized protein n=1 Tax=Stephania japonica TaxID=461633 RepID=A0AAP0HUX2_9MAGN
MDFTGSGGGVTNPIIRNPHSSSPQIMFKEDPFQTQNIELYLYDLKDKINESRQSQCSKSTVQSISDDPISQVFGTEPHGQVRGLGFGVTPTGVGAAINNNTVVKELQILTKRSMKS